MPVYKDSIRFEIMGYLVMEKLFYRQGDVWWVRTYNYVTCKSTNKVVGKDKDKYIRKVIRHYKGTLNLLEKKADREWRVQLLREIRKDYLDSLFDPIKLVFYAV